MKLRSMILAAACGGFWAMSWDARAQPIQGVYIGVGAGVRAPLAIKTTPLAPGFGKTFELNQRPGFDTALSLGYAIGNGWRFELEGNVSRGEVRSVTRTPFPTVSSGTLRHHGVMVNALFDLDVGSPWVYPYFGLGAGYQASRLNGFAVTRTDKPFTYTSSDETGGFAMQAIVGLSLPVPYLPGLSVTLDYRFMDILGGQKFSGTSSFGPPPGAAPASGAIKLHNQFSQSGLIGIRYAFNTPPPAAAAAEPPASVPVSQMRSYLVAFDPDNATMDDRAAAVVREAAQSAGKAPLTRIDVTGAMVTGTAGGVLQTQALAERRARAVASALVGAGVPRDAIAIRGGEEAFSLTTNGPGVASRQQRRVEIFAR